MGKHGRSALYDEVGSPPKAYGGGMWDDSCRSGVPDGRGSQFVAPARGTKGQRAGGQKKFNLRGVIEVLEEYQLDPTAEIAKALRQTKRVMVDGKEVEVPVIDAEARAKLSLSLLEYVKPKLKSIEIEHKGPELTSAQIDQRLEALLARAFKK